MQSIDNVLMLRKGLKPNDPNPDIFDVLWAKKLSAIAEKFITLTGNPLNFTTKKAQLAKSTKISMTPIQEGTGDPSPTNICPISGRSNVTLNGCGKNLWNNNLYMQGYVVNEEGNFIEASNYNTYRYKIKENMAYTFSANDTRNTTGRTIRIAFFNKNNEFISYVINRYTGDYTEDRLSLTIPAELEAEYVYVSCRYSVYNHQLEEGSTATAYEPYAESNDITISFGQTVYGGTLDVENGEVTITQVAMQINPNDWLQSQTYNTLFFWNNFTNYSASKRVVCNKYKSVSGASGTAQAYGKGDGTICLRSTTSAANNSIYIRDDSITDIATFRASMSDLQIIYMLKNPTTISLTPEEVQLLKGVNNIWTDGDTIELTYKG